ncbi:MAG TPA: acetate uptake transporter [Rhodopila sp.]|nr:acetate uptake transporter [Rhodopila sp.]
MLAARKARCLVAFCAYGAFWWNFALFVALFAAAVPHNFIGWWLLLRGVFTFFMWLGSLALNRAVQVVFLSVWITFLLLALGDLLGLQALSRLAGYTGLATAVFAFYLAAAEVINEAHGRVLLPVGAHAVPASEPAGHRLGA